MLCDIGWLWGWMERKSNNRECWWISDFVEERDSWSGEYLCWWWVHNCERDIGERESATNVEKCISEMEEFNLFIEEMEVGDIPMVGLKYTRFRPNGRAKSCLDRIFISPSWVDRWSGCFQHVLERNISNHCPMLLKTSMGLTILSLLSNMIFYLCTLKTIQNINLLFVFGRHFWPNNFTFFISTLFLTYFTQTK